MVAKKSHLHWNYFSALEHDLEVASRYIEFIDANFGTYSIELAHLLLASSSEIDVVMKEYCNILDPGLPANNIDQYKKIIKNNAPSLINEAVYIDRYGLSLMPWTDWNKDVNPLWWGACNKVKHERHNHFTDANLENVLNSLGALLVLNFYYYRAKFEAEKGTKIEDKEVTGQLQPKSKLFTLKEDYYYATVVS